MNKVWFTQKQLKAVANFMGNEEKRYYLNGVFCDPKGYLVATDGHRLGTMEAPQVKGGGGYIIPREAVKAALKHKPERKAPDTVFSYDGEVLGFHYSAGEDETPSEPFTTIKAPKIDGPFPDYRRVIPSTVEQLGGIYTASFNAEYLESFKSQEKGFGMALIQIVPTGGEHSPILVTNATKGFLGVIMPCRGAYSDPQDVINLAGIITGRIKPRKTEPVAA